MKSFLTSLLALSSAGIALADQPCSTTITAQAGACQATQSVVGSPVHFTTQVVHVAYSPARDEQAKDIVDTAVAAGSFNTLVAAVKAAGLVETLKGAGPFTVFAPTDEAFAKIPKETLANLLKPENKAMLQGILTYHVVPGAVKAADVVKLNSATTVQGQSVDIVAKDGAVKVDGANVVKADIVTSNGVIHVIDSVIMPNDKDIVDTAVSAGNFKTLVAAVKAAGLVETLKGSGPFTVFAPTDEAFAKLPEGTVESLLKPENKEKLVKILTYHVVPAKVMAAKAVKLDSADTVAGIK
ncbi:MAG: fasciclin domain-containing protein, partial [Planctomycetales bacterium]|nr:fasciclin domain-containing protein [Planctomycetales bacterium]